MQTIRAKVQVGDDRTLWVQLPDGIAVGEYEMALVLKQPSLTAETSTLTPIQQIQSLLKQSVEPGYSLADELIQERRQEAEHG